ncbi:glycosyltransferase family 2 protein [Pseudarthrobacter sp902506025]|uniref:glycosyltransferase family 2 protein n=1 Tax=Pseudarthrobacter sp. 902506025 TaxID=3155291 RepID=UPI003450C569
MERISVIATVYNRVETSLRCFRSLQEQKGFSAEFSLDYFVVDDLSKDGTPAALSSEFPENMHLISGSGDLFWSGGMALAHTEASREAPDWILWVNDDVELCCDAVTRLLATARESGDDCIVVGAMRSAVDSATTYSGMLKTRPWPGGLQMISPEEKPCVVDAFHGNLVLIPRKIYEVLGGVDGRFAHAYGDIDYGLRAKARGFTSVLAAGYFGTCETNPVSSTWVDNSLPFLQRVGLLFGRKGYPFRSHVLYNRKHGGRGWPLYVGASYAKALSKILISHVRQVSPTKQSAE